MNCFNIRELQGILKRKFFTDLVNTSDSHTATDSTLIAMRHKHNMSNILMYDQSLLYNFDLNNTSKFKTFSFTPGTVYTYIPFSTKYIPNPTEFIPNIFNISLGSIFTIFTSVLKGVTSFIHVPSPTTLITLPYSLFLLPKTVFNALYINTTFNILDINSNASISTQNTLTTNYTSSTITYTNFHTSAASSFSDNSST